MNSNTDWAKCLTTLCGNHFVIQGAKIIKLTRNQNWQALFGKAFSG
jgi:hypothetical protein